MPDKELGVLEAGVDAAAQRQDRIIAHYPWAGENIRKTHLLYAEAQPIRFGELGDCAGPDIGRLELDVSGDDYWVPPEKFHQHMRDTALKSRDKLRLSSRGPNPNYPHFPVKYPDALMDREVDDTVRIAEWAADRIRIERATYLDQLATNINPDLEMTAPGGSSYRQIEQREDGLVPFAESVMANTIGVAALVVDRNWSPLLAWRELTLSDAERNGYAQLAVMPKGLHCFSSGVLTWQDRPARNTGENGLQRWLLNGLRREMKEETGFSPEEGLYSLIPYAFARELERAGKPQFFVLAKFHKTAREITDLLQQRHPVNAHEYSTRPEVNLFTIYSGKQKSGKRDVREVSELNLRDLTQDKLTRYFRARGTHFTYEAYASLFLAAGRLKDNPQWDL